MITVAIPTFNRGAILVETIGRLIALEVRADAILIVDQTPLHPPEVESQLEAWSKEGTIRWLRLPQPSIPKAMNRALREVGSPVILFLDDDVEPSPGLIAAHAAAHRDAGIWAVVGQVLQPGESPQHFPRPGDDLEFRFNHDEAADVTNVIACNLSVKGEKAIGVGGFDENYIGAAYRFETDFSLRVAGAGGIVRFEPLASVRHLKLATGGLRSYGDHLVTASPLHSVGDYYFALQHRRDLARYVGRRLLKNVITRYHVSHPWTIPTKLVGEFRGWMLARRLRRGGLKLMR
ncbi:MAG: glycosyltransferase [Acidobacteriota bacterium]